ncbi:MAG: PH domain-containing protein [Candidatus Berkelbacteria bacterium]|nr:MAG: PH domain-containing protein [Candidatus Berkelbacteria bacterium]QQG51619.1 MAG: PH domain-containing protein [Candidatus Berkelbacteria bacterium]
MKSQETETFTFKGQRSGEEVLVLVNQHTWVLLPIAITWLVLLTVGALSLWYFGASKITSIVIAAVVIFGVLYSVYQWYIWNFSNYILTNQRVIKIDQISMFSRLISEAEIGRIQEISTEIAGPIHTLLNFGTVRIQTASNAGRMDLEDVPDPYSMQQEIVRIQRQVPTQSEGV